MAIQRILDRSGDTVHEFEVDDKEAVAEAMERFKDLVKNQGYWAVAKRADGSKKVVKTFDPTAPETMFMRQLIGG